MYSPSNACQSQYLDTPVLWNVNCIYLVYVSVTVKALSELSPWVLLPFLVETSGRNKSEKTANSLQCIRNCLNGMVNATLHMYNNNFENLFMKRNLTYNKPLFCVTEPELLESTHVLPERKLRNISFDCQQFLFLQLVILSNVLRLTTFSFSNISQLVRHYKLYLF